MKQYLLPLMGVILSAGLTNAAVTFSGTDGTLDFEKVSKSFTLSGIEVTLEANNGTVNGSNSGLGINDSFSGVDADDTDGLDTKNVIEMLTVSFNVDVIFNTLTLSDVGVNDGLSVSFNSATPTFITSSSTTTFDTTLLAGDLLTLTAFEPNPSNKNNGVQITSFTVTAIPEPSSAALLGLAGFGLLLRRQRI